MFGKNGNKQKVWILVISFVVIAAISTAAYFLLSRKSPRTAYLEAESKNFKKYSDQIKEAYKDFYAYYKPYMDAKYRSRTEVTADIKSTDEKPLGINNAKEVFDLVRRCKLILDRYNHPAGKESLTKAALFLQSAPVADVSLYAGEKELGFTIPVLLPGKYFTLNPGSLDAVYERYLPRYGVPLVKPKRIMTLSEVAKSLKFREEEFDRIIREYGAKISEKLQDKNVRYGKDAVVKVGNEEIKGREILVELTEEQTRQLAGELLKKVSTDASLLQFTYENYADIAAMLEEAGLFQLAGVLESGGWFKKGGSISSVINIMNVKKDTDGFKSWVGGLGDRISFPGGLKMTLVVDSTGNILERKVKLDVLETGGRKTELLIHSGTNAINSDNFKNGFCSFTAQGTDAKGQTFTRELNVSSFLGNPDKNKAEKGPIKLRYSKRDGSGEGFTAQAVFHIDRYADELTARDNRLIQYTIELSDLKSGQTDSFKGNLDTVGWKNNKQKTRNTNTSLGIGIQSDGLGIKDTQLKLELKKEDRFEAEFTLPAVAEANKIRLDRITEEELVKLEGEIEKAFGSFYVNNKFLVDTILSGSQ